MDIELHGQGRRDTTATDALDGARNLTIAYSYKNLAQKLGFTAIYVLQGAGTVQLHAIATQNASSGAPLPVVLFAGLGPKT